MIKANELRIGNYVNYEQTTHLITGVNIDYSISVWVDKENQEFLYQHQNNELKPIPLTEEWLIKFGFEKYSTKSEFYCLDSTSIYEGTLNYNYKNNFISLSGMNDDYHEELILVKPMLYVHQLQNLYFALTNEELTIK